MKIFSVPQIKEADQFTIEHEPISSIDLMERASKSVVNWLGERFLNKQEAIVVCGLGNNGGDGLAISRLLIEKGWVVKTIVINYSSNRSVDFQLNYDRLKLIGEILEVNSVEQFSHNFNTSDRPLLIDAIIGSGLNKPLEGLLGKCIEYINSLSLTKISIDIPSGLFADKLNSKEDVVLNAAYTLSFQFPKLSFMFPENAGHVGSFSVLNIGLSAEYIEHTYTSQYFILKEDILSFYKTRNAFAHKGNFGHALIVAGSKGKIGAAVLSSRACMRSGAGLLTVRVPSCGYAIMQVSVPEAMIDTDTEENFVFNHFPTEKYHAIGIGPGIGQEKQTQNVLKLLIQNTTAPLVLDADAINILADNKTWIPFLPANAILTPHLKEFERLVGACGNSQDRLDKQRDFSIKNKVIVVLKGHHTSISAPTGELFFNSTGNAGMATAGSGDVLTGIITSFLAQGYSPLQAAILGVYMHGLAGDFAAKKISMEAIIASDIVENLSDSFLFLNVK